jgi:hypothetical protein
MFYLEPRKVVGFVVFGVEYKTLGMTQLSENLYN